jgi:hypothetical protein
MSKNKTILPRNYVALNMITRSWGAGSHGDKRKEQSRKACRGKHKADD